MKSNPIQMTKTMMHLIYTLDNISAPKLQDSPHLFPETIKKRVSLIKFKLSQVEIPEPFQLPITKKPLQNWNDLRQGN